jgi:alpha-tubulin suppressor-like RCC1 family protein
MRRRDFAIVVAATVLVLDCDRDSTGPELKFSVSPENPTLFPNVSMKLDLTLSDVNIAPGPILWSSSAPNFVSVDDQGRITGVSPGSAVIKAAGANASVETTVTVVPEGAPFYAGFFVTCGVSINNEAYCWGDNTRGQLGIGSVVGPQSTPQRVSGSLQFSLISGSYGHTCGMTTIGAFCWGENDWGAIGDGTRGTFLSPRTTPVKVLTGESFVQIDANGGRDESGAVCADEICQPHSVALDNSGRAFWWGIELRAGTPSSPSFTMAQSLVPAPSETDQRFLRISAGVFYTCGITTGHVGYCWGYNTQGESGGQGVFAEPHAVAGAPPLQSISAGRGHTCGLSLDGDAYCWGSNAAGELGGPSSDTCSGRFFTNTCSRTAVKVAGYKFIAISVGPGHLGTSDSAPQGHTCGITVTQSIVCWGRNTFGQLGNGTFQNSTTPVRISQVSAFK